jgi:glycosyltransferase involved in cell wall biosynthesis
MVAGRLEHPLYRTYQLRYWIRRREWRVVADLLRGAPPPRAAGVAPAPRISVALTAYHRSTLALEAVRSVAADPRIAEIVVSDDASEPSEYRRLHEILTELSPKVRVHRNDRNRGPLWNKHRAVSLCTREFAILFDSDNVLDIPYLDCLFRAAPWRRDCFYCPEYARPRFDLRCFGGVTFDLALVRRGMLQAPGDHTLDLLLNEGNHLVPVREYCEAIGPFRDLPVHAADAFAASYLWMRRGGRLHVLRGLAYDHRIHDGSYSLVTRRDTTRHISEIRGAILAERTWPSGAEGGLREAVAGGHGGP